MTRLGLLLLLYSSLGVSQIIEPESLERDYPGEIDWKRGTNIMKIKKSSKRILPAVTLKSLVPYSANHEVPLDLAQATMGMRQKQIFKDFEKWYPSREEPGRRSVPFVLDFAYTLEERGIIIHALSEISRKTCVDFIHFESERDLGNSDFLYFLKRTTGCQSWIGRQGGKQVIRLSGPCVTHRIVLHEVMHSFGFFHQHSTPNRDDHIAIVYDNIEPATAQGNFEKVPDDMDTSYGAPYDFSSVLHYRKTEFAKQGTVTFYPKSEIKVVIGERPTLSFWDIYKIRRRFGCYFVKQLRLPF